ncbi:MAG: DUF3108 domain-containing protein [Betaproteobacteria bacterium]
MMPRAPSVRLLAAASMSLMLHAALMSGSWLQAPKMRAPEPPLHVDMVRAQPAAPLPAAARPAPRTRADAQGRPKSKPVLTARPASETAPRIAADPEPAQYAEERNEPPMPESLPMEAAAATAESPSQRVPVRTLPRKGRIAYTMYYGDDAFTVGKTVQTWEVQQGGYKLGSVSETTGIVEFFRSQRHVYLSEGRFTDHGLQPEKFFMSRTRRGRTEAAQALFDWESGVVTLGRVPQQRGAALVPDTQDIVSFMYHLALSPPAAGRIRLPVTNGSRFETYDLDVLDEENIETPMGVLRALPVRQVPRPGVESIAVWLAIDYRHLPVRLRFFDRDGRQMAEQVVDQIQISDE